MCFDLDSQPPLRTSPDPGVAGTHEVVSGEDGNLFRTYGATPARTPDGEIGRRAGVVVLPDVRGIYPFYEGIAIDLANHGYHAIVVDYYGRTAGAGERPDDFDAGSHVMRTTRDGVAADVRAAAEVLRTNGAASVAAVGFCFGARHAFWASAPEFGFSGVVGFYGFPGVGGPLGPGPTQHADRLAAPILGIFGGADDHIPASEVEAFGRALTVAGVDHEIEVYPGAPHSFFDIKHDEHAEASVDAWRRTHRFLDRTTRRMSCR